MKKKLTAFAVTLGTFLTLANIGLAQERLRGPLPAEQRELISFLADHHKDLKRKVTLREDGYSAETTSENAEVVTKLVKHIQYMKKRLGSGAMVRRWDPAFVEMVEYHDQLQTEIELLKNGVRVVVKGKTPNAVKVARNHARIVSGFVEIGSEAVGREHKTATE